MKAMLRIGCLTLITLLISCEVNETIFTGPYHVRFSKDTSFERESFTGLINIEVHIVAPALPEDLIIAYEIGGTAREGIDYIIESERGTVTIPAGEYFGNIKLRLINNANNILRSQTVEFRLINTNNSTIKVGQGTSRIGEKFVFTIFDDCILGGTYREDAQNQALQGITVSSTDCKLYIASDVFVTIQGIPFFFPLQLIDEGDNSITVKQQTPDGLPDEYKTVSGLGAVNPITREIILTLDFPHDTAPLQIQIRLTPQ